MNNNTLKLEERAQILDEHRRLILEIRRTEKDIEAMLVKHDPAWHRLEEERGKLEKQLEPLIGRYWQWVPAVPLSRCPYCRRELLRKFDPVDLHGFWWMDRTQRPVKEPPHCPHFCLLLGAVDFHGQPPKDLLFSSDPGPDKPFVIPRLLKMAGMAAVVSSLKMSCGYTAYPIAYFSEQPLKGRPLTQSWAQKEYHFTLEDGRHGWDIVEDKIDFRLEPWKQKGKVIFILTE